MREAQIGKGSLADGRLSWDSKAVGCSTKEGIARDNSTAVEGGVKKGLFLEGVAAGRSRVLEQETGEAGARLYIGGAGTEGPENSVMSFNNSSVSVEFVVGHGLGVWLGTLGRSVSLRSETTWDSDTALLPGSGGNALLEAGLKKPGMDAHD